jgi:hypothetical protein
MNIGSIGSINTHYPKQNTSKTDQSFQDVLLSKQAEQKSPPSREMDFSKMTKDEIIGSHAYINVPTLSDEANIKLDKFLNEKNLSDAQKGRLKMSIALYGIIDRGENKTADTSSYGMNKTLNFTLHNIGINMKFATGEEYKSLSELLQVGREFQSIL